MSMQHKHVLVCVTGQRTCERLIRQGAAFAGTLGCRMSVIHVAGSQTPFMGSRDESGALEYLYQVTKEFDADMTVLRAQDTIGTIAQFAKKYHITHLVLGGPVATGKWSVPDLLKQQLPQVEFFVIPSDVQEAIQRKSVKPCVEQ